MEKFKGVDIRVLTEADLFNFQGRVSDQVQPAAKTMPSPQSEPEPEPEPKVVAFEETPVPPEEAEIVLGIGLTPEESVADYLQKAEQAAEPKLEDGVRPPVETGKKKRRRG